MFSHFWAGSDIRTDFIQYLYFEEIYISSKNSFITSTTSVTILSNEGVGQLNWQLESSDQQCTYIFIIAIDIICKVKFSYYLAQIFFARLALLKELGYFLFQHVATLDHLPVSICLYIWLSIRVIVCLFIHLAVSICVFLCQYHFTVTYLPTHIRLVASWLNQLRTFVFYFYLKKWFPKTETKIVKLSAKCFIRFETFKNAKIRTFYWSIMNIRVALSISLSN